MILGAQDAQDGVQTWGRSIAQEEENPSVSKHPFQRPDTSRRPPTPAPIAAILQGDHHLEYDGYEVLAEKPKQRERRDPAHSPKRDVHGDMNQARQEEDRAHKGDIVPFAPVR